MTHPSTVPIVRRALQAICVASCIGFAVPAGATVITDPANDFLSTYTGPKGGDLDVLTTGATTDGHTFALTGTFAAAVGTTANSLYVFGIDRGTNNAPFGSFASGVLFDAVVTVTGAGVATVRDLVNPAATVLPASDVTISGSSLSVSVPAFLLPTEGLPVTGYLVNLWPRVGAGNNNQISDFAPDNSDFAVSFVPEPATWGMLGVMLAGLGFVRMRRRG